MRSYDQFSASGLWFLNEVDTPETACRFAEADKGPELSALGSFGHLTVSIRSRVHQPDLNDCFADNAVTGTMLTRSRFWRFQSSLAPLRDPRDRMLFMSVRDFRRRDVSISDSKFAAIPRPTTKRKNGRE